MKHNLQNENNNKKFYNPLPENNIPKRDEKLNLKLNLLKVELANLIKKPNSKYINDKVSI